MRYISTRGAYSEDGGITFSEAVLKGLAPDGGLFVPMSIPKLSNEVLKGWLEQKVLSLTISHKFISYQFI